MMFCFFLIGATLLNTVGVCSSEPWGCFKYTLLTSSNAGKPHHKILVTRVGSDSNPEDFKCMHATVFYPKCTSE